MDDGFIFDGKPSLWQRFKQSALYILFGVILLSILGFLVVPDYINKSIECQKWGLGLADPFSESCSRKFSDIIFVVGDTQNTPAPTLNATFEKFLLTSLKDDDSRISAISVSNPSRNPREILAKSEIVLDGSNAEDLQLIADHLSRMSATRDGADYLEAIRSAVAYADNPADTLIYVIGSGLSDRGLLNFADDQLLVKNDDDFTAESIAARVYDVIADQADSSAKELKGVSVIWDNIGQVVAPQTPLGKDSLTKVQEIYKRTLAKLGASGVLYKSSSVKDSSVNTVYTVKTSKTSEPRIIFQQQYLDEFKFHGDSAEFINRNLAETTARDVLAKAQSESGSTIHIKAYMSRGEGNCNKSALTNYDRNLLSSRLDAVKRLLGGFDENRIYTEIGGFGSVNECPNGVYNETEAAKNRLVEIVVQN